MYIILRPGPYVCSEWEMGGLPWWLLKKKDIQLRTNDPYFLERTKIYMNEVGKQLADLQAPRGGNIIMVQVENEYGAYAVDKEYIANIRDIVRGAGFTDVPLFQCDWSCQHRRPVQGPARGTSRDAPDVQRVLERMVRPLGTPPRDA